MATFYSKQTGNWEDGANWSSVSHTGPSGASPGVAGTDYPGTGDTAVISAGHTITVTTDLSGLASPVLLQCDAPGTNNGTLKFSPTANTGLKFTMSTINSASTFTIQAGTRTAPIRRGNTCTLVTAAHFRNTSGTLSFEGWGQHREHSPSDVYCDILTVAASRGNTTITLNGDISPTLAANDWLWITEGDTNSSNPALAELVQIDSYNSGTKVATLKTPLKNSYTTTNALVFRAKEKLVNTVLTADHSSGADYVLEDNLYPSGTGGGSFLVQQTNASPKANAGFFTYSSYNSSTKTLTASSSSSTAFNKGSFVLMDDFNVTLDVTAASQRIGSDTSGSSGKFRMCYMRLSDWRSINSRITGLILYNTNLFGVLSLNNDTITGYRIQAYGLGAGYKSGSTNGDRNWLTGSNGYSFIRCRLARSSDGSGALLGSLRNGYFEDCILMAGTTLLNTVRECIFRNCWIGNITGLSVSAISGTQGNQFQDCGFWGVTASNSVMFDLSFSENNIMNNIIFGENSQGKVINNNLALRVRETPNIQLINGVRLASGEPEPTFNLFDLQNNQTGLLRCAMYGMVTNQFANYTPGGNAKQDTSGYRSSSPSVKFTHSSANHPVWFDIPMFLNTGSKTITIYTNPSTGAWSDAPQIFLLAENQADQCCKFWQDLSYVARAEQTTLTTSVYSQLQLTTTISTAGIYILRLWARNASGTLNWDDISVT